MTCNGCRSHVEEALSKVKGVSKATVDLKKAEATIEMEKHIPLETFQEALKKDGGKYSIHKSGEHHHISEAKKETSKGNGTGTFYCRLYTYRIRQRPYSPSFHLQESLLGNL